MARESWEHRTADYRATELKVTLKRLAEKMTSAPAMLNFPGGLSKFPMCRWLAVSALLCLWPSLSSAQEHGTAILVINRGPMAAVREKLMKRNRES